jgi:enoyl-CoA hydratase/carnithine racemase
MTDTGSIGLNEVALGISVPKFWGLLMQQAVGVGPADKLLQFAVMVSPAEAKEMGMVDVVVPQYKLLAAAEGTMSELLKAPDAGRAVRVIPNISSFCWKLSGDIENVSLLAVLLKSEARCCISVGHCCTASRGVIYL